MKLAALIVVALVVPGGSIALLVYLRRLKTAREAVQIDDLIRSPRPVFVGSDEGLEVKARARREIADQVRKRSALIASGSSSASVLKIARKA